MNCDNKQCTKCLKIYPSSDEFFYKQKTYTKTKEVSYKLTSWCKECMREKSLERFNENKDYENKRRRDWYKENKAYSLEQQKKRNNENKEHMKQYQSYWQQINKDKIRKYNTYRQMHKMHEISKDEWIACKEYFNNSCAYCGLSEDESKKLYNNRLHKEHVDHNGSNGIDNCIPACKSCNTSKHQKKLSEWYNKDNTNYTKERNKKIHMWLENECYKIMDE